VRILLLECLYSHWLPHIDMILPAHVVWYTISNWPHYTSLIGLLKLHLPIDTTPPILIQSSPSVKLNLNCLIFTYQIPTFPYHMLCHHHDMSSFPHATYHVTPWHVIITTCHLPHLSMMNHSYLMSPRQFKEVLGWFYFIHLWVSNALPLDHI
jgi:hypothetical protein